MRNDPQRGQPLFKLHRYNNYQGITSAAEYIDDLQLKQLTFRPGGQISRFNANNGQ